MDTKTARVGDKDLLFKSVPSKKNLENRQRVAKSETTEDGYFVWVNNLKFGSKKGE